MLTKTNDDFTSGITPGQMSPTKYDTTQTYKTIPGTIVKVLLEFPDYQDGKSAVIELDDVMTLSYSVFRVKAPVVPLGQNNVDGYALGVKTVAGTMIRSVFMTDRITDFQTRCYLLNQQEIKERLEGLDGKISSGVPLKDQLAFMKDDLAYFNIHMLAISEESKDLTSNTPFMRQEMIIGAMIINNGQTYSVEDLITETSFSFQAKAVRSASDPSAYSRGFSGNTSFKSISSLM